MNIEWDAKGYDRGFGFVHKYGEAVTELIDPCGGFAVDLGCGSGELTKKLSDMGLEVLGIDDSEQMLRLAGEKYPDILFERQNALELRLKKPADIIFSNAVFHWIDRDKQEDLARSVAKNLKKGGQLVCEFGGKGCAETVHSALEEAFSERGLTYKRTFYFPTAEEYSELLERCGFKVVYTVLFDRPTLQKGEDGLQRWIKMFVKEPFEGFAPSTADEIIKAAEEKAKNALYHGGDWIVDYVRIRVKAIRE